MLIHIGYADRNAILEKALEICTVTEKKLIVTTETKDASAAEFTDYLLDTIRSPQEIRKTDKSLQRIIRKHIFIHLPQKAGYPGWYPAFCIESDTGLW